MVVAGQLCVFLLYGSKHCGVCGLVVWCLLWEGETWESIPAFLVESYQLLKRLPSHMPGVTGLTLGLVGLLSAYCIGMQWQVWSAACVLVRTVVLADLFLRYTCLLLGCSATNKHLHFDSNSVAILCFLFLFILTGQTIIIFLVHVVSHKHPPRQTRKQTVIRFSHSCTFYNNKKANGCWFLILLFSSLS